jgi:hypothetical protein
MTGRSLLAAAFVGSCTANAQPSTPASQAAPQVEAAAGDQERAAIQARIRGLENELALNETALKNPTLTDQQREGLRLRSIQLTKDIQSLRSQLGGR